MMVVQFNRAVPLSYKSITMSNTATYPITANDAANVLQLIDVCAKRGAFQGPELGAVASIRMVFDKIVGEHKAAFPEVVTPPPAE